MKTPRLVPESKYTQPLRAENTGASQKSKGHNKSTKTGKKDGKEKKKKEGATQNHQNEATRQVTAERNSAKEAKKRQPTVGSPGMRLNEPPIKFICLARRAAP